MTVSPAEQVERAERWIDRDGGYAERETAQLVIELAGTLRLTLAVVEALQELRAAEADWERISRTPFTDVRAERSDLPRPATDAPLEVLAKYGEDLYRPYRARVAKAKASLDAALAAFDASSAGAEKGTATNA